MKVRTRYAPSPTGYFHIGGARTALYNYLFAKHYNGEFIVRIEDTDIERNVKDGDLSQLNNINWMQIEPHESPLKPGDFGPYYQTKKLKRYEELANQLIKEGKAYYCFCSKEELDKQRELAALNHQTPKYNRHCLHLTEQEISQKLKDNNKYVIRLKIDENKDYCWNDLIRGKICINGLSLTDPVILKSNKVAMYNFAVVIDDYDMQITHVLRGEEHISNTPYQIAIKEALGFDKQEINYGHLSIIVNKEGKKLSKRDINLKQFISDYRYLGYLPSAIDNFLALLGWSPRDNKEVMNLEDMINKFELKDISISPAQFDETKMQWISNNHFKNLSNEQYLDFVKPFVKSTNQVYLKHQDDVLLLLKPQISYAAQINKLIEDLFSIKTKISEATKNELSLLKQSVALILLKIDELLSNNELNSEEQAKKFVEDIKIATGLKAKNLFMSTRIITSLQTHGPELAKVIYLLGKQRILENIKLIKKEIENE